MANDQLCELAITASPRHSREWNPPAAAQALDLCLTVNEGWMHPFSLVRGFATTRLRAQIPLDERVLL